MLVEVDCETDFVARNDDFIAFARDVALHIAAASPLAVTEDELPAEEREREERIAAEQAAARASPRTSSRDRRGADQQVARGGRAARASPT